MYHHKVVVCALAERADTLPLYVYSAPICTLWSYQWTKARLAYMRSNLWSSLAHASMMAVVLDRQHTARCTCNTTDKWTLKTPNPKCRLFFKTDLITDFAALCLTDYIDWRYIQSWSVFSNQLVNCCPPWTKEPYLCTVAPLPSLWPPPPPPFPN